MKRFFGCLAALTALVLIIGGCSAGGAEHKSPGSAGVKASTAAHDKHGHWDAQGKPVNGGPAGADGSTGNNLTREYCARNEDPGCPKGSYVGPNAQRDPRGGPGYVPCEGTICTNPNHGAGTDPRTNGGDNTATGGWDANGNPVAGGPRGADGSTGNNLTRQYCAANQNPRCPAASYGAPQQR